MKKSLICSWFWKLVQKKKILVRSLWKSALLLTLKFYIWVHQSSRTGARSAGALKKCVLVGNTWSLRALTSTEIKISLEGCLSSFASYHERTKAGPTQFLSSCLALWFLLTPLSCTSVILYRAEQFCSALEFITFPSFHIYSTNPSVWEWHPCPLQKIWLKHILIKKTDSRLKIYFPHLPINLWPPTKL